MRSTLNFLFETNNVEFVIKTIKMIFITICTYYTNFRLINRNINVNKKEIWKIIIIIFFAIILWISRYEMNYLICIVSLIYMISIIFSVDNIKQGLLATVIANAINYAISFLSIIINYIINKVVHIENDYVNLVIIVLVHFLILKIFLRTKKLKYGINFLRQDEQNEYTDLLILNISTIILISIIFLVNPDIQLVMSIIPCVIIFFVIMIKIITKSIQLNYKQKLLIQDLTETKSDLEKSKQEIQKLEKENIELSKKNHSFNHKYKALEHKLKEELLKTEMAEEISLKDQLDDLSKEIYVIPQNTDPSKTNIEKIDDMLKFMQSECDEHKITFNLQVIGNIYHMTNNFISQEELQILIADHIKDAIIAINHSDNINKSILVKLGKIEDCYGLYIYDSGIEFEKETLENLGKKPITTHINEGGSGMGFMNTFDTLRRHNASLIIEELGKPCKDNFTKIIKFKFDGKNEFKVISYRNK